MTRNAEQIRLDQAHDKRKLWRKWGPYLSERQWGTVREDYSEDGDAWRYFSHDEARSRVYRWGEDGIAGVCDDRQRLCLAFALWNGKDPILKERLFGLTNAEGNHGEDVKEYYFYLDSTPTHSYMRYLYKYPHAAYPYDEIVAVNRQRSKLELEYELIDTGVFDEDRYFDVFIEYCKASPEDILVRATIANRGPDAAPLHFLPTLWFRNLWSGSERPRSTLRAADDSAGGPVLLASEPLLGERALYCDRTPTLLFTENETNNVRLFGGQNAGHYVKDAFHEYLIHGKRDAVNPARTGTKAAAHYELTIPGQQSVVIRLRLSDRLNRPPAEMLGPDFDETFAARLREADEFYKDITPETSTPDEARVLRQSLAGMLWSKQYYFFDVNRWLDEHHGNPLHGGLRQLRNREWYHMVNEHVISMPDKWEYPWYAAWDLAFHSIALTAVDPDFAREQLDLMLRESYMHPSGQIPAYEWNFADVNPPVHAWATLFLHRVGLSLGQAPDMDFLKRTFNKLTLNFSWWVNRKDRFGKNVFEGGFLGLDNIGVFDRSAPLPTGGHLEQADGTAWVALFCQNMMELSIELAAEDSSYEDMCLKFVEHFLWIASAMNRAGPDGMWDEEDGFYYDVLRTPDGNAQRLKVRSMVGLLPLCATTVVEEWQRARVPRVTAALGERVRQLPSLLQSIHATGPDHRGVAGRGIIALVNEQRLRRILSRMLDENEFLSPYGLRALSRYHDAHPFTFQTGHETFSVRYLPAESDTGMFGGNSNWRGPIWMPMNVLIIRALLQYYMYYGDSFQIECPTGSGHRMTLFDVSMELSRRLTRIFLRDGNGRRPVFGAAEKFQSDPLWRDHILFYEYFHGDNGAGLGASHQTGWTGVVARLIQMYGKFESRNLLKGGKVSFGHLTARGDPR